MSTLSDADIAEFQELYFTQTGKKISKKRAQEHAEKLLDLAESMLAAAQENDE